MRTERFSVARRLQSFRYAARGIAFMLRTQHNAWIHLAASVAVCGAGLQLHITSDDWRWLAAAIVAVWASESTNTAFENLCDVVSPELHPSVEKAKDVAAGAVLICSCGAAVLGILTLWPYVAAAQG